MSESPLVSIILPVYNAEATLESSLRSACSQENVNLELICINDGSSDSSAAILDAWAARDPRIRVIHQANAGVAAARNSGLDALHGDYFTLLDADDHIAPGYLAPLLQTAREQHADAVITGWMRLSGGSETPHRITDAVSTLDSSATAIAALPPAAWGRLYSTGLLRRCGARYPVGVRYGEDMAFNFAMNAAAQRIICHPSVGYHYLDNPASASNNSVGEKVTDMTTALAALADAYTAQGMDTLRLELLTHYASQAMRRIRSMAPHRCQHDCARRVSAILSQAGVQEAHLSTLRSKDARTLRSILRGGDGLGPGYYWRRLTRFLRGKA